MDEPDVPLGVLEPPPVTAGQRFFGYLQLVRLPNLFTALADVTMGFLFTRGFESGDAWLWGLLAAASALCYAGGVVLNDVCDFKLDQVERPERPLPAGLVPVRTARNLALECLVLGLVLGGTAAFVSGRFRPALVSLALVAAIVLYNLVLKPTLLGPVAMGLCRFLNVLLGMSLLRGAWRAEHWLVAAAIGTYIVGVTCMARSEAVRSRRLPLVLGLGLMMAGVALLGWLPRWTDQLAPLDLLGADRWYLLLSLLGAMIAWRGLWALIDPRPHVVQTAVAQALLSLIMLDAAACFAARDVSGAIAVLLFLVPTIALGQLLRMT